MKRLLCFIDSVDFDIEIKQIENPVRHVNIFWQDASAVNTADEHILELLEDMPSGGPIACRPTGQLHWLIGICKC